MQTYLVETYLARAGEFEARATSERVRVAAGALTFEGTPVSYVRTTFLPDDETCFHLVEAESLESVEEVSRRAALGRARIVAAVEASRPPRLSAE